jgi:hypothetical protein
VHQAALGANRVASLTAGYRHERVDPLYRSLAAPAVRSDFDQHAVDVHAAIGDATARVSIGRGRDNLGGLESVLTTRTRTIEVAAVVPPTLFRPDTLCGPTLSYELQRVGQAADGLPVNGGFDSASQVPDQLTVSHGVGVEVGCVSWRAGYRLNHSLQDNRQPGRDAADFAARVHQATLAVSPSSGVDLGLDIGREDSDAREIGRVTRTHRVGGMANLRWAVGTTLDAGATWSATGVVGEASPLVATEWHAQLAHTFGVTRGGRRYLNTQVFARVSRRSLTGGDPADLLAGLVRGWQVNTGVTVRFF